MVIYDNRSHTIFSVVQKAIHVQESPVLNFGGIVCCNLVCQKDDLKSLARACHSYFVNVVLLTRCDTLRLRLDPEFGAAGSATAGALRSCICWM